LSAVAATQPTRDPRLYSRVIAFLRAGPLQGPWFFAWIFLAQLGHLIEHISVAIKGSGLFGPSADTELTHLLFNGAIAVLAVVLMLVYTRNPWVYPLVGLTVFHLAEHVYIYQLYLQTGVPNGPGLLGLGGVIGVIPLDRLDLHNAYNGLEMVLIALGLWYEIEVVSAKHEGVAHA
jgi:hypothetical protein